jgi:hypothetical protein
VLAKKEVFLKGFYLTAFRGLICLHFGQIEPSYLAEFLYIAMFPRDIYKRKHNLKDWEARLKSPSARRKWQAFSFVVSDSQTLPI